MKRKILYFYLLLAGSLGACEEPLPSDVQIDLSKAVKEKLLAARKQGWDLSAETKTPNKKEKEFEFSFVPGAKTSNATENLTMIFRSDGPEGEKGKRMDQLHEAKRNFQLSKKKVK